LEDGKLLTVAPKDGTEQRSSVERILERTIEVIETSGEAAIRTNPIAFECGVTPPILYRAFGSREGLVVAAQAERYRRSTAEAAEYLYRYISEATSRESLRENISLSLDFIFGSARSGHRRLRAEVIGSGVSRPELRAEITRIDREYAMEIAHAYLPAVEKGWISKDKNLEVIAVWAQGIVNMRMMIDDSDDPETRRVWDSLSKAAILDAIFG
jgi:AcrR family transcriptional regulator